MGWPAYLVPLVGVSIAHLRTLCLPWPMLTDPLQASHRPRKPLKWLAERHLSYARMLWLSFPVGFQ